MTLSTLTFAMNFYNWTLEFCTLLLELGTSQLLIYFTLLSTSLLTTSILIDLQTLAKWFGFRHFVHIFSFAGHSPLRCGHERPYWKQDFCTVFLFMYSYVFSLLFWFDFNLLIFSCYHLGCICSDCSFCSTFLIWLILLLS